MTILEIILLCITVGALGLSAVFSIKYTNVLEDLEKIKEEYSFKLSLEKPTLDEAFGVTKENANKVHKFIIKMLSKYLDKTTLNFRLSYLYNSIWEHKEFSFAEKLFGFTLAAQYFQTLRTNAEEGQMKRMMLVLDIVEESDNPLAILKEMLHSFSTPEQEKKTVILNTKGLSKDDVAGKIKETIDSLFETDNKKEEKKENSHRDIETSDGEDRMTSRL